MHKQIQQTASQLEHANLPAFDIPAWAKELKLSGLQPSDFPILSTEDIAAERPQPQIHSVWRLESAHNIASRIPAEELGLKTLYLHGSVNERTAGPGSDIDLIAHISGSKEDSEKLLKWLEDQDAVLSRVYQQVSGHKVDALFDLHIITDQDVAQRTSYAALLTSLHALRPTKLR